MRPLCGTLAALALLIGAADRVDAQHIGLEPGRLAALLDLPKGDDAQRERRLEEIGRAALTAPSSALWLESGHLLTAMGRWEAAEAAYRRAVVDTPLARLGIAAALVERGQPHVAMSQLHTDDPWRLRYARVLLQLRTDRAVRFADLRAELAALLAAEPHAVDVFDLWLGLNPDEAELEAAIERLDDLSDLEAVRQRAEVRLRLGQPELARREIEAAPRGGDDAHPGVRSRLDRVLARAFFEDDDDRQGQEIYARLLDRLDATAADVLYQDVAVIASREERRDFASQPETERASFFRRFWTRRDPTPGTPDNSRIGEHYRRLADALSDYPLQSTGRGFFTDAEIFATLSPTLRHFDAARVFEEMSASRYWLDPRGLILTRHGAPARRVVLDEFLSPGHPSESWLLTGPQTGELVLNFVKRPTVGEWSLALNLAIAVDEAGDAPDDPQVLDDLSLGALRRVYRTRARLHTLYREAAAIRSADDAGSLLGAESRLLAGDALVALGLDSTSHYSEENTLPTTVSAATRHSGGRAAVEISFAIDLARLPPNAFGEDASFVATARLYDADWSTVRHKVRQRFPLRSPPSGDFTGYVGVLRARDVEPDLYHVMLDVHQPESAFTGLAAVEHEASYVHPDFLGVSDLTLSLTPDTRLARPVGAAPDRGMPLPGGVVPRGTPFEIGFSVYHLQADASGAARYEVEEQILTLEDDSGTLSRVLDYGSSVGQLFFPLYSLASRSVSFALSRARADGADRRTASRVVTRPATDAVTDTVQLDLSDLETGLYSVSVTVRDLVTEQTTSESMTFGVR